MVQRPQPLPRATSPRYHWWRENNYRLMVSPWSMHGMMRRQEPTCHLDVRDVRQSRRLSRWLDGRDHAASREPEPKGVTPESFNWELYNINDDFSQGKDLAKAMPEKLREMQDLWSAEAGRNNTLPLNFSPQATAIFQKPSLVRGRNSQMPMGATARPVQRGKRKGRVVPGRRAKALSRLALLAPPSWGE